MLGIGSFFERFRSRELEEIIFYSAVIDSLKEILNYEVHQSVISYSNNTIFLKISPAAKNAVFLKKNEILKKIQDTTKKKVLDIK